MEMLSCPEWNKKMLGVCGDYLGIFALWSGVFRARRSSWFGFSNWILDPEMLGMSSGNGMIPGKPLQDFFFFSPQIEGRGKWNFSFPRASKQLRECLVPLSKPGARNVLDLDSGLHKLMEKQENPWQKMGFVRDPRTIPNFLQEKSSLEWNFPIEAARTRNFKIFWKHIRGFSRGLKTQRII